MPEGRKDDNTTRAPGTHGVWGVGCGVRGFGSSRGKTCQCSSRFFTSSLRETTKRQLGFSPMKDRTRTGAPLAPVAAEC
jgi:hypothetical protein